ncbi:hypothetical protein MTO96_020437, partial [Rhipicephalus appendiculatus]
MYGRRGSVTDSGHRASIQPVLEPTPPLAKRRFVHGGLQSRRTSIKTAARLAALFQYIVNDLKGGTPIWEDFLAKASKLHSQLKITASVSAAFLDSFQKVADMATNTKGATKEVGKALTRLCLRHRSVEAKLRSFT